MCEAWAVGSSISFSGEMKLLQYWNIKIEVPQTVSVIRRGGILIESSL